MCPGVTFAGQLALQGSLKMIEALSLRLNQYFVPFSMSPFEGSSETGAFRHLSNDFFRGR